eukprot:TRINITY_DN77417_c0_g1_i1.p1 TRINITY_DN77417_c0_g1~~TRINITY_DN77417_c0_g1_i1.p1  ORF type:complete len:100 (+),score=15.49 TRINITY_DN77417_c0_g1_i1:201-500(+)
MGAQGFRSMPGTGNLQVLEFVSCKSCFNDHSMNSAYADLSLYDSYEMLETRESDLVLNIEGGRTQLERRTSSAVDQGFVVPSQPVLAWHGVPTRVAKHT